jgi:hypothetical protein
MSRWAAIGALMMWAAASAVADVGTLHVAMTDGTNVYLAGGGNTNLVVGGSFTNGFLKAESDPLSIHTSTTFTAWTTNGVSGTTQGVVFTTPLLTNGVADVVYNRGGSMFTIEQWSGNGSDWSFYIYPTNVPSYMRLLVSNSPSPYQSYWVSNVVVTSWSSTGLWNQVRDTAGQIMRVDDPSSDDARQVANVGWVQGQVAGVTPSAWADYQATADVRMEGRKLLLGGGWTLSDSGGFGYLSYDSSTNGFVLAVNGTPIMQAISEQIGLHINAFEPREFTNALLWVSTNSCADQPVIQITSSILTPDWSALSLIMNGWPTVTNYPTATNPSYRIEFAFPDPEAPVGYVRAVCGTAAGTTTFSQPVVLTPGTTFPSHEVGKLFYHSVSNKMYCSDGAEWRSLW